MNHSATPPATLMILQDPAAAIKFALERLEAFLIPAFLADWQAGKPLQGWLEDLEDDRQFAQDCADHAAANAA